MSDWEEDLRWFLLGLAAMVAAFLIASYSDYRTLREDECAAQGMRWDQGKDKCVPRKPRVAPEMKA